MDDTAFALQQLASNVAALTVTVAQLGERVQQLEAQSGAQYQQPQPYQPPQPRPWRYGDTLEAPNDEDAKRMENEGGKEP